VNYASLFNIFYKMRFALLLTDWLIIGSIPSQIALVSLATPAELE
jgi:hypothetical protein